MSWSAGHTLLLALVLLFVLVVGVGWFVRARRPGPAPGGDDSPVAEAGTDPAAPAPVVPSMDATSAVEPTSSDLSVTEPASTESAAVEVSAVESPAALVAEETLRADGSEAALVAPSTPDTSASGADSPDPVELVDSDAASVSVDPAPASVEAAPVPAEPVAPVAAEPVAVGSDDDLRRIEGIGPKMAAALKAAGFRTYRQLAETDEATLRATIRGAGLRAVGSLPTWPGQARALAGEAITVAAGKGGADGGDARG